MADKPAPRIELDLSIHETRLLVQGLDALRAAYEIRILELNTEIAHPPGLNPNTKDLEQQRTAVAFVRDEASALIAKILEENEI